VQTTPLIGYVAQSAGFAATKPRHKGPVELKRRPTLITHKTPNVLGAFVLRGDGGGAGENVTMPVNVHFESRLSDIKALA
jgi:hypothetical protein